MAKKSQKGAEEAVAKVQPFELVAIEDLAQRFGVPSWQMAGLRVRTGWRPGKFVSVEEFQRELRGLLASR
jgi:hypothetical protein